MTLGTKYALETVTEINETPYPEEMLKDAVAIQGRLGTPIGTTPGNDSDRSFDSEINVDEYFQKY